MKEQEAIRAEFEIWAKENLSGINTAHLEKVKFYCSEAYLAASTPLLERIALLQKDADLWRWYCCPQTALYLGTELDPNDESIDWYAECTRLATALQHKEQT